MFLSVIVPAYNAEKTIIPCIESLLKQSYPKDSYEIIVIDNLSTDKTAEIVKSYPVRCLSEDKIKSSYAARNRGILEARGDILAFTDADCVTDPDWLRLGAAAFSSQEIGCVSGEVQAYEPVTDTEKYLAGKNELSQTKTSADYPFPYPKTANAFYRKSVFERIGDFEKTWVSGGDADFAWRMQIETSYKLVFIPEALVRHKHRATLSKMFKQCAKWGIGYSLLAKKYRRYMPPKTLKKSLWSAQHILRVGIWTACALPFAGRADTDRRNKIYDAVSFLGWELGKVFGGFMGGRDGGS